MCPFVILGTGMLWFGWFGFNAGSAMAASGTAALAFATTNTASAAAMLSWMFFDWMKGNKPSALGACIGAVVGLVAITPAAGYVTIRESIVIGVVASVVSNLAVHWKTRSTLDDTLDVFPCHGVGGMTGMVMTGIFAKDVGLTSGKYETFLYHLLALVIVAVFAFGGSWLLYKVTDWIIPLRVTDEQETRRPRSEPARRDGPGARTCWAELTPTATGIGNRLLQLLTSQDVLRSRGEAPRELTIGGPHDAEHRFDPPYSSSMPARDFLYLSTICCCTLGGTGSCDLKSIVNEPWPPVMLLSWEA